MTPKACSRSSPLGDLRQIALLLLGAAVPQHRAHRVHLRVAGGAVAAGRVDLLHDGDGRRHGEPAAAVFLGDQRGEKAGLGQRVDELGRIGALAVELAPVFAGKVRAQRAHRLADAGDLLAVACIAIIMRDLGAAVVQRDDIALDHAARGSSPPSPSRHISVRMVSPGKTGAENRPRDRLEARRIVAAHRSSGARGRPRRRCRARAGSAAESRPPWRPPGSACSGFRSAVSGRSAPSRAASADRRPVRRALRDRVRPAGSRAADRRSRRRRGRTWSA